MRRTLEVLAVDWERLRRARPSMRDDTIAEECITRGHQVAGQLERMSSPSSGAWPEDLQSLRARFVQEAALVAVHRFDYAVGRDRFDRASRREEETYREHLDLEKDVVPPLKQEAAALKAEVRRLEHELRSRGVDPESIEPSIDWRMTPAVDDYRPPRFQTPADRRRHALEFFRRQRS